MALARLGECDASDQKRLLLLLWGGHGPPTERGMMTREQAMELIHRQWAIKEAKRAPARAKAALRRRRLALYPDLVKVLAHLEADWRLLWPVTVSESLKEAQAVIVKAEAIEKEAKG